jgi:hypothetical protein
LMVAAGGMGVLLGWGGGRVGGGVVSRRLRTWLVGAPSASIVRSLRAAARGSLWWLLR